MEHELLLTTNNENGYLRRETISLPGGAVVWGCYFRESTRGVHGGYTLTRSPEQISVLDVITVVEGEVSPVECVSHDYVSGSCPREGECASRGLWQKLKRSIDAVLSQTTIAELVADHALMESMAPVAGVQEIRA